MAMNTRALHLTSSNTMGFYIHYFERHRIPWREEAELQGLPTDISSYEKWLPIENTCLFIQSMRSKCPRLMSIEVGKDAAKWLLHQDREIVDKDASFQQTMAAIMTNSAKMSRQLTYWLEMVDGYWCLCSRGNLRPGFPGYAEIEWHRIAGLIGVCQHWLGRDWLPKRVQMTTARHLGAHYDSEYPGTWFEYDCTFALIELPDIGGFQPLASDNFKSHGLQEVLLLADTYAHLPSFTIDWLASLFGTTRKTLYRFFKQHGISFTQIKDEARFKKASYLLQQTDYAISDIAYRVGYNDTSNFNRAMKTWSGKSAAQFRKSG
ncbi:helix-turn-helix domain-containing protein [Ferrimonas balearica]|uniref:helix-turn-helix domain-containing protein n=1 Tax=Ferrimonas balearica TaxID=44012 RepID=UPI001C99B288|nr:AraC family transcriptional regulator [Ferrimonas balearica]MBY5991759.1 AraC family transcriptional regulator [Ferrimonas balearica]